MVKSIVFNRETRDYTLSLDGELVGYARSYHEGEHILDELIAVRLNADPLTALSDEYKRAVEQGRMADAEAIKQRGLEMIAARSGNAISPAELRAAQAARQAGRLDEVEAIIAAQRP